MQAKLLLSFFLICTVLQSFAQKLKLNQGDRWIYNYRKNNADEEMKSIEGIEATGAFKVKSKIQNGSYNVEARFPFVLYKFSKEGLNVVFNSAHPEANSDLDRTKSVLAYFFLYSQPLEIELGSDKRIVAINNLNTLIEKKLAEWNIKENFKKDEEKEIAKTLTEILNTCFSQQPLVVPKIGRYGKNDKTNATLKKQPLQREKSLTFENHNNSFTNTKLENQNKSNEIAVDANYLDMVINGSFVSGGLITNGFIDSIKTINYIDKYNTVYSSDKSFALKKLSLLQQIHNWPRYKSELRNTPVKLLEGSFHLSNKINDDDISDNDFNQIAPILSKDQLYDWLQHSFSHSFLRENNNEGKLNRLANHSFEQLHIASLPMQLWVRATKNKNNVDSLNNISNTFTSLSAPYWNDGNASRYALLTYKIMDEKNNPSAAEFLETIKVKMLTLYQDCLNKKRYEQKADLAYAWYLDYLKHKEKDVVSSLKMLEQAAFYSPKSEAEKPYGSFYDRVFLKSKENYTYEYYKALANNGKKEKALGLYIAEFLNNPAVTFARLKLFYEEQYKDGSFAAFFKDTVLQKLPDAPMFELENIVGQKTSLHAQRGKWVLVDFWGTWCSPCVEEIPKINDYNNKLQAENNPKISLLTIACHDSKERVQAFQKKNSYSFPALMSDGQIEHTYKIPGYPTKVIISPEGKMITVYFGSDWQSLMESLSSL